MQLPTAMLWRKFWKQFSIYKKDIGGYFLLFLEIYQHSLVNFNLNKSGQVIGMWKNQKSPLLPHLSNLNRY